MTKLATGVKVVMIQVIFYFAYRILQYSIYGSFSLGKGEKYNSDFFGTLPVDVSDGLIACRFEGQ